MAAAERYEAPKIPSHPVSEQSLRFVGPGHDVTGQPVWGQKKFVPHYAKALQTTPVDPIHYGKGVLKATLDTPGEMAALIRDAFAHGARTHMEKNQRGELFSLPYAPIVSVYNAAAVVKDAFVQPAFKSVATVLSQPVESAHAAATAVADSTQNYEQLVKSLDHDARSSEQLGVETVALAGVMGLGKTLSHWLKKTSRPHSTHFLDHWPSMTPRQLQQQISVRPGSVNHPNDMRYDYRPGIPIDPSAVQKGFVATEPHGFRAQYSAQKQGVAVSFDVSADPSIKRIMGDTHQMAAALMQQIKAEKRAVKTIDVYIEPLTPKTTVSGARTIEEMAVNHPAVKGFGELGFELFQVLRNPMADGHIISLRAK